MSLFVKLCGIRTEADLEAAVAAGADAVGFVLTPSPRQVAVPEAARLVSLLPDTVLGVAVYHQPSPELVRRAHEEMGPDLHQSEPATLNGVPADRVLPVIVDGRDVAAAIAGLVADDIERMFLVDSGARGGVGVRPDWDRLARVAPGSRMILAGGLDPGNVAEAISTVRPFGVDVSSGIERGPGEKDPALMRAFVEAARAADL
jgi:phosphoribosylanthranilate isomerase